MVLALFLWVPSFSMVICFAHSTLQVPQPSLTLNSVFATQWDHARVFLLCHSLEHACRHIIGLTLFVSFSLGLQFYVAYSPTSEIIELLHFPGFLDACNVRKTPVRVMHHGQNGIVCSFLMAFCSLLILQFHLLFDLLKHFMYSHFTPHVWVFQYLKPLSI